MPPRKTFNFTVDQSAENQRIDLFLAQKLPQYSRSFLKKIIEQKMMLVDGEPVKPSKIVESGSQITFEIPDPVETEIQSENIALNIIYEDKNLLVVNKAAGMVVHPGAGVRKGTLVNALMHHCVDLSGVGGRLRPGIVHRLDKNTSGLLVVAKDDQSHRHLQKQFAEKTAQRRYYALVWRRLEPSKGEIRTFLSRSKSDRKKFSVSESGKEAITFYEVEDYFQFFTLVKVWLKTGRSHQIRVHFKHRHHPVFGDPDYSGRNKQLKQISNLSHRKFVLNLLNIMNRQALHAFNLGFEHPAYKKHMNFEAPLPNDFQKMLLEIKKLEGKP